MASIDPEDGQGKIGKIGNEDLLGGTHLPDAVLEDSAGFRTKTPFRRTTLFQILVVGICAFCAPGIWSAMNGLGVGGSQSPDLVNAANALLYAFMTVTCFMGPWVTNVIGFKYTLAIGSLGYPLYAAVSVLDIWFLNIETDVYRRDSM